MKVTKTIDVSHLSDEDVSKLEQGSYALDKLVEAKAIIAQTIKLLRRPQGMGYSGLDGPSNRELADALEKMVNGAGLSL